MKNTSIAVMEMWQRKVMKLYWTTSKRNHMTVTPIKSAADTIRFLHNNKSATANWIPNLSESWQGHCNRIKYANSRNGNHWKLTNVTEHKYLTSYTICRVFVGLRTECIWMQRYLFLLRELHAPIFHVEIPLPIVLFRFLSRMNDDSPWLFSKLDCVCC